MTANSYYFVNLGRLLNTERKMKKQDSFLSFGEEGHVLKKFNLCLLWSIFI